MVVAVLFQYLQGQGQTVSGIVTDSLNQPLTEVNVYVDSNTGTSTDTEGFYQLTLQIGQTYKISFSHVRYKKIIKTIKVDNDRLVLDVQMVKASTVLQNVTVRSDVTRVVNSGFESINLQSIRNAPSPSGDISRVLATLPSVLSNNELASSYSVRGGNYDENLVYVNGIKIYRPFLARSGNQEGLGFINTDMVQSVTFSAGGWSSRFGDKMSSVLDVIYKRPKKEQASFTLGLLGGSGHYENSWKNGAVTSILGIRHKRTGYILNTQDITGDYTPTFTDIQNLWDIQINDKQRLEVLFGYAANRYKVVPKLGEVTFGSFNNELRFNVAFDGQQQYDYNLVQGAIKLSSMASERLKLNTIVSYARSRERENIDLEGGYRLCDLDKNQGSPTFNSCLVTRGIGTTFDFSRNRLEANFIDFDLQGEYKLSSTNNLAFGITYSYQEFNDQLNEYGFLDSLDYPSVTSSIQSRNSFNTNMPQAYIQHEWSNNRTRLNYGFRINYNSLNKRWLVSPRLQLHHRLPENDRISFSLGTGLYQQPPVYREYRDDQGQLHKNIRPQSAFHLVTGMSYHINWWGRPFEIVSAIYGKFLWNQIPYTFEDVKIRYLPTLSARGYALGAETRVGGEFISGTESWFSLSIASTKEKITGLDKKYSRRPTDQRLKFGILFEDHVPWDPTYRVNLNFQYSSGLPFGPPGNISNRNVFSGDSFTRMDVGFSKIMSFTKGDIKDLRINLQLYNLLGIRNAVTYAWITDINGQQFAVPNNLTGRLINVAVKLRF